MSKRLTVILLASMIVLCGGVFATEKGPISDVIYFNVKMSQELGLRDVAEGLTDIFMEGVSGPTLMGMDKATRDKMDIYSVPALTYALFVNPYPNEAPYFANVDGKDFFNVMAINEFRYALNDLINRQYIVDEILGGAGGPMLSMATPGQPGTYRYGLVANKLGLSFEGNETRALEAMKKALEDAAKIPENQGRLVNSNGKWYFDNEPLTVKFVIRADDPNVRVKMAEYVSLQLEKAGVTVDRLVWERSKASNTAYGSDPADLIWNLYTFDQQLRLLCFKAIEAFEVFLRKQLSYYHSRTTNDPFAYVNVNAADPLKHGRFLEDIQRAYTRLDRRGQRLVSSKDDFVIHFFNTYEGDHLPLWMMVEVVSFGTLVTYYRYYLPQAERETLSNTFGITPSIFNTWLSAVQEVRNICAHHGRLWNRRIRSEPDIEKLVRYARQPQWHFMAGTPQDRTFAMLCVLNHCLRAIDPGNAW
ncbi:Abi family protein, partial [Mesotoga prima]|uniref:Abi family protein n=1 Tax=Mesotoga prima TaxID=1184387 RepID=UPI002B8F7D46